MSWGKRYPQEQQIAQLALLASADAASSTLSNFVGWLLAVSGASFALLVANLETISSHIGARSFKWALVWYALSLLFGLLSRWLGTSVSGAIAAVSAIRSQAERTELPQAFSLLAFTKFYADASLPIYRCVAWWSYRKAQAGNFISGIRPIIIQSQLQALLTLAQLLLLFVSVAVLAHGVKA